MDSASWRSGPSNRTVGALLDIPLVTALVATFLLGTATTVAQATEGEHDVNHCAFTHSSTKYRYIDAHNYNASPQEFKVDSATYQWMATARAEWNGSGPIPTSFNSVGVTGTPQHIRVFKYNVYGTGSLAFFGNSGCSPKQSNWSGESAIGFNEAFYGGYTIDQMRNTAVHEIGHAVGLAHSATACSGSTPLSVMKSGSETWNCSLQYGPYSRDTAAALRIKNRARFVYRNTLSSGSSSIFSWQTENDDRLFRGRESGATADGIGTFDDDTYGGDSWHNSWIWSVGSSTSGPSGPDRSRTTILVGTAYETPGYLVAGNANGWGYDELASFAGGKWRLAFGAWLYSSPGSIFWFGAGGDIPLLGDWDCNGTETVGVFRPSTGQWFLRNSNSNGPPSLQFYYGNPGDKPVAGSWDTASCGSEIGVVRGLTWYMREPLSAGSATTQFNYPTSGSTAGMQPILGDWDGDGDETPGYHK